MPLFIFEDKATEGRAATRYYDWSPVCREIGRPARSLRSIRTMKAKWSAERNESVSFPTQFPANICHCQCFAFVVCVCVLLFVCTSGCVCVHNCACVLSCILVYRSLCWLPLTGGTLPLSLPPPVHLCFSCTLSITVQPGLTKIMNPSDKRMWAADSALY